MNFTEEIYKKKYLKYKAKYLELRGGSFLGKIQNIFDPKTITKDERDFICKTPDYDIIGCDEKLKNSIFDKLNKDERNVELKKLKNSMINQSTAQIKYTDGTIYIGELTNGVINDNGTLKFPNGNTYEGEIKIITPNGMGEIKKIIPNGMGVLTDPSGEFLYIGTFIDGKQKGKESLEYLEGAKYYGKYYGEVLNGKPHGYGELKYYDFHKYIGCFKNGKKDGWGEMRTTVGSYIGEWENDKKHGYGVFTDEYSGNRWEGTWNNGEKTEGKWI
jgi:hypothetical protein